MAPLPKTNSRYVPEYTIRKVSWSPSPNSIQSANPPMLPIRYGYFQTRNSYFVCRDPDVVNKIFARLRKWNSTSVSGLVPRALVPESPFSPLFQSHQTSQSYASALGGIPITRVRDLTYGHEFDSSNPPSFAPDLPSSGGHMITFRAQDKDSANRVGIVLTIRSVILFSRSYCTARTEITVRASTIEQAVQSPRSASNGVFT